MKKINLTAITFKPSLGGQEVTENLQKNIAEAIYQSANSLAQHSFAQRLYEAEGEIEASEEEVGFIKGILSGYKYFVQEGILKALGE